VRESPIAGRNDSCTQPRTSPDRETTFINSDRFYGSDSMKQGDLNIKFTVDQSPKEVYDAVNNVRAWWSGEIIGDTKKLGSEWTYRYQDLHRSTQKITEMVPGKRVVWHVTDSLLSFVKDKTEWNGTDIVFEIAKKGAKTELSFTHVGLAPNIECYGGCSTAWRFYVKDSLRKLITTGVGSPNSTE
jgi:hypothetical protein